MCGLASAIYMVALGGQDIYALTAVCSNMEDLYDRIYLKQLLASFKQLLASLF